MARKTRRELLRIGGAVATVGASGGCLRASSSTGSETPDGCAENWSPGITSEEPTVAPGEETSITVSVTNVAGVNFRNPDSNRASFMMDFQSASLSPRPAFGSDASPPGYRWDTCTDVEITIPVVVPADADAGTYSYIVRVTPPGNEDPPSFEREFTITVSDT